MAALMTELTSIAGLVWSIHYDQGVLFVATTTTGNATTVFKQTGNDAFTTFNCLE